MAGRGSSYRVIDEESLDEESWKVIGAGGFGQVYKARHLQWKSDVAIKLLCFDDGSSSDKYLLRECELMRRAESPHVIQVLGVFKGRPPSVSGTQIGLFMELMERGSLASLQKKMNHPLPWSLVFRLAHQVSLGMKHLHSLTPPILHKDLKPDNVLLDRDLNVKITDFGLSKFLSCSTSSRVKGAGTISYMPPEALISFAYKSNPTFDVYSYGILLCSIVKGKEPYESHNAIISYLIPKGQRPSLEEFDLEQAPGLADLIKLMKMCWHQEPEERPLFPVCADVTEALYEKHEPGMKDAVHQVIAALDAADNWTSTETDSGIVVSDSVDKWTSGEMDARLEKHFVDKHRRFLIKNVTAVDPILDLLLEEDVITNRVYEKVRSKSTTQKMMRELYSFLKTIKDKDIFYKGLEEEENLLLNKLDGGARGTRSNASNEPEKEDTIKEMEDSKGREQKLTQEQQNQRDIAEKIVEVGKIRHKRAAVTQKHPIQIITGAEDKLLSVRKKFIRKVSDPILNELLDELLDEKIITDEEMGTAMGEKLTKNKARSVIDMVRKKGNHASSFMIGMIDQLDYQLSEDLQLKPPTTSTDQPDMLTL